MSNQAKIKEVLAAAGYPVSEGEGLSTADLQQYRDYAFFHGGENATQALYGLAYPAAAPGVVAALVAHDVDMGTVEPEPEAEVEIEPEAEAEQEPEAAGEPEVEAAPEPEPEVEVTPEVTPEPEVEATPEGESQVEGV